MNTKKIKKAWNWVWNSDSALSWIVALILIFVFVKLIFFPTLSFIMGTSLPLAGVESSSMDHQITKDDFNRLSLCGRLYLESEKEHKNFEEYWNECGDWYENKNISKQEFSDFSLKNGFKKGDVVIVWGRFKPKIGDIIVFKAGQNSLAPRPIIHRIVNINEDTNIIQTKGDHNGLQLTAGNNPFKTDETNIKESQIMGKAIIKIPYLGWPKIWITDLMNKF